MNTQYFMSWLMWALPTLFFAYQFIVRIIPGLIMPELMQKFEINATEYGLFASIYYVGYAGIQIPLALLLDRYGPRHIISLCVLIVAFGTFLLIYTNHWLLALVSRLLVGLGSAAGFLGTSKLVSLWFPQNLYSRMIGLNCTFGLMGAVYGGRPMNVLISQYGWENVLLFLSLIGFGMAISFFILIKNPKSTTKETKDYVMLNNLKNGLLNRRLIIIAVANLLMVGALEGFADVWGISYLMITRTISKSDAALITSTIFVGMLFGGPMLACIANKLGSYYRVVCSCGFLLCLIFLSILYFNSSMSDFTLYALFFMVGLLCCYQVLVFSIGVNVAAPHLAGVTVAFLNCVNMLGGSFFHGIIGYLIDFFWNGQFDNNEKIYDVEAYTSALTVIPIAAAIGGVLFFLVNKIKRPILSVNQFIKRSFSIKHL